MVKIEQRPLRPFEKDTLPAVYFPVQVNRGVRQVRHNATGGGEVALNPLFFLQRLAAKQD